MAMPDHDDYRNVKSLYQESFTPSRFPTSMAPTRSGNYSGRSTLILGEEEIPAGKPRSSSASLYRASFSLATENIRNHLKTLRAAGLPLRRDKPLIAPPATVGFTDASTSRVSYPPPPRDALLYCRAGATHCLGTLQGLSSEQERFNSTSLYRESYQITSSDRRVEVRRNNPDLQKDLALCRQRSDNPDYYKLGGTSTHRGDFFWAKPLVEHSNAPPSETPLPESPSAVIIPQKVDRCTKVVRRTVDVVRMLRRTMSSTPAGKCVTGNGSCRDVFRATSGAERITSESRANYRPFIFKQGIRK
jgi:hypothetical protein